MLSYADKLSMLQVRMDWHDTEVACTTQHDHGSYCGRRQWCCYC
jgi:hypothetical protein